MDWISRRSLMIAGFAMAATFATSFATYAAQDAADALVDVFETPGHVIVLRHALAPGKKGKSSRFDLADCGTQRNLSEEGREQSMAIGAWLRERLNGPVTVYTSQYCRCVDTADLMDVGPVVAHPALNALVDSDDRNAQKALKKFMGSLADTGTPAILVTHTSNISVMVGGLLAQGEGIVVKPSQDGSITSQGRLLFGMPRQY